MINRVVLVGRLTRDPEFRTTHSGKSVVEFSIAVNKRIKPQDGSPDADFFRVKAWGNTADFVANYLDKGRLVAVDGRLEQRRYTDQSGNSREIIEIVADNVQSLERPRDDAAPSQSGGQARTSQGRGHSAPTADEYDPFADE